MDSYILYPFTVVQQFLASYGWFLVGASVVAFYLLHKLRPRLDKWKQAREDAEYHKDPDKELNRMQAIQRARDQQQERLLAASQRALQEQKEREERKNAERLELLKKYGSGESGHRLGDGNSDGAGPSDLPLSRAGSSSSYRPPKRSACSGGGCGR